MQFDNVVVYHTVDWHVLYSVLTYCAFKFGQAIRVCASVTMQYNCVSSACEADRHTIRHIGPCPCYCSFGWCLPGADKSQIIAILWSIC